MPLIRRDGFQFEFNQTVCSSCTARCCRGNSGNIWVNTDEISNICNFSKTNLIDGLNRFFEKRENRYSIREQLDGNGYSDTDMNEYYDESECLGMKEDYRCIFLDNDNQCSIYPVRPLQCRTFPFWENFKTEMDKLIQECPGVTIIAS